MKIGLYGGSFDPVHLGHVELVNYFLKTLSLDKVFVIPAFVSPFKTDKPPLASAESRLEMLKIAFQDFAKVEISSFEIDKKNISYTIDTVKHFIALYPEDEIYLLLAEDLKEGFDRWRDSAQIKDLVKLTFGPLQLPISSTIIRDNLLKNKPFRKLLPQKVFDYIEKLHLYK
jgi:nicotinate-nucleotide adenylyltransferase